MLTKVTKQKRKKRYWYTNDQGVNIGVSLDIDETNIPEYFNVGLKPLTQEQIENKRQKISRTHKGVEKSPEQKLKMRLAKLNIPKDESHKKNMSKSHLLRTERVKLVQEITGIKFNLACTLEVQWKMDYINHNIIHDQRYVDLLIEQGNRNANPNNN